MLTGLSLVYSRNDTYKIMLDSYQSFQIVVSNTLCNLMSLVSYLFNRAMMYKPQVEKHIIPENSLLKNVVFDEEFQGEQLVTEGKPTTCWKKNIILGFEWKNVVLGLNATYFSTISFLGSVKAKFSIWMELAFFYSIPIYLTCILYFSPSRMKPQSMNVTALKMPFIRRVFILLLIIVKHTWSFILLRISVSCAQIYLKIERQKLCWH